MDIKTVGNNVSQVNQRTPETGNFHNDFPAVAAQQAAVPVQTVNAVQQPVEAASAPQVKEALKHINETLKKLSQNLEFSVDSDGERPVVKVVDQQTKEVLRQIPTEEALEIAKALDRVQGLLIREKA